MAGIVQRGQALKAAVLSLPDLEREAAFIVATAQAEGRRIVERAEARARAAEAEREAAAGRRGFAAGHAAGVEQARNETREAALKEARDRLKSLTDALAAAVREYDAAKHRLLGQAESGLITLALAIAQRICKQQAGAIPDVAVANVRALLDLVRHAGDLEVHLNPAQCDPLAQAVEDAARELGQARHVRIVPDASVSAGGCRLVAGDGHLDARIETQLDRIAASLCGWPEIAASEAGGSA